MQKGAAMATPFKTLGQVLFSGFARRGGGLGRGGSFSPAGECARWLCEQCDATERRCCEGEACKRCQNCGEGECWAEFGHFNSPGVQCFNPGDGMSRRLKSDYTGLMSECEHQGCKCPMQKCITLFCISGVGHVRLE